MSQNESKVIRNSLNVLFWIIYQAHRPHTPHSHVKVKSLNKKLLIDNNITVPTDINSLSTKSAKSYNKS